MTIKSEEYKDFSWDLHQKAGRKPLVAQMELTLRCPLHCRHCYADFLPAREALKRELSTTQVKQILDKCKEEGVTWFCFTGGDPMLRKDFIALYLYAKKLGFITSVFTSLTVLKQEALKAFKQHPPFNIETTINAADAKTYKRITGTNLFNRQLGAIKKLIKNDVPVRVKTQVTKQNAGQIDKIKKLVESLGLRFRPSTMIYARLNGDSFPCSLRVGPEESVRINKDYGYFEEDEDRWPGEKLELKDLIGKPRCDKLLACAAGGHAFWITVEGKMIICSLLRTPDYDLLKKGHAVKKGFDLINKKVHGLRFKSKSRCRTCKYRRICRWCPARAYLETGSLEEPIEYFCRQAEETVRMHA